MLALAKFDLRTWAAPNRRKIPWSMENTLRRGQLPTLSVDDDYGVMNFGQ